MTRPDNRVWSKGVYMGAGQKSDISSDTDRLSCRNLLIPIHFYREEGGNRQLIGETETEPLSTEPMLLKDIYLDIKKYEEPFYLIFHNYPKFCVYPVTRFKNIWDWSIENLIVNNPSRGENKDGDLHGALTHLYSDFDYPQDITLVIGPDGMSYVEAIATKHNWYLIGNDIFLDLYFDAIANYVSLMIDWWKKNKTSFIDSFKQTEPNQGVEESIPEELAFSETNQFLEWLKIFDISLFDKIIDIIEYKTLFRDPSTFALYNGKIIFLPPLINELKNGDYQQAAATLAHELSHMKLGYYAVDCPAKELIIRGAVFFLANYFNRTQIPNNLIRHDFEVSLILKFEEEYTTIPDQFLTQEALAYLEKYLYAKRHLVGPARREELKDSLNIFHILAIFSSGQGMAETPQSMIALSFLSFYWQAIMLKKEYQNDSDIDLFIDGFRAMCDCVINKRDNCREKTESLKKLEFAIE